MFSFASVLCSVSKNICSRRFLNFEVHFVSRISWLDCDFEPFLHNILSLPYIYIIARILRFVNKFYSLREKCSEPSNNTETCGEKLMKRNRTYTLMSGEILLRTAHFPARLNEDNTGTTNPQVTK